MSSMIGRIGDRLLARLVPTGEASASSTKNCRCECSDVCFYCCYGGTVPTCNVASGSQCM